ncbi:hypothetical protein E0Z10_g127 [Xylaria hypoxylon]|uniref:Uncharacterized protein n=1 Tax=Xylaria hypoxylon TaxID=37992 RepID=A0A4Z0YXN3_9PEZI|nr:hypothetical protein E0Z10_g127 [Xylaria hypoxylon]
MDERRSQEDNQSTNQSSMASDHVPNTPPVSQAGQDQVYMTSTDLPTQSPTSEALHLQNLRQSSAGHRSPPNLGSTASTTDSPPNTPSARQATATSTTANPGTRTSCPTTTAAGPTPTSAPSSAPPGTVPTTPIPPQQPPFSAHPGTNPAVPPAYPPQHPSRPPPAPWGRPPYRPLNPGPIAPSNMANPNVCSQPFCYPPPHMQPFQQQPFQQQQFQQQPFQQQQQIWYYYPGTAPAASLPMPCTPTSPWWSGTAHYLTNPPPQPPQVYTVEPTYIMPQGQYYQATAPAPAAGPVYYYTPGAPTYYYS